MKDKDSRRSKGVAFVLFLDRESAHNCVRAVNNKQVSIIYTNISSYHILDIKACAALSLLLIFLHESSLVRVRYAFFSQLFGRTVKASIAIDNGRAAEFIRRRNYTDKSKCYECGVSACFFVNFILVLMFGNVVLQLKIKLHHFGVLDVM